MTKFAKDLYGDLRESRLWPLALALAVALVAVPVVLSKPAKKVAAPASAVALPATGALPAELQPILSKVQAPPPSERNSVMRLSRKNPFQPLKQAQSGSSAASTGTGSGTTGAFGSTSAGSAAVAAGGASTGTTTPTGGTTGTTGGTGSTGSGSTTQVFYTYVAEVKFGELGNTQDRTLQRLRSLPSSDNPIVVFLGATVDGDTAVFLVSTSADPSGDGTCKPSKDQCSFLYMKKGDSETFDVADATGAPKTYELTLSKISAKKIDSAHGEQERQVLGETCSARRQGGGAGAQAQGRPQGVALLPGDPAHRLLALARRTARSSGARQRLRRGGGDQ